jgi:hypothetical protein
LGVLSVLSFSLLVLWLSLGFFCFGIPGPGVISCELQFAAGRISGILLSLWIAGGSVAGFVSAFALTLSLISGFTFEFRACLCKALHLLLQQVRELLLSGESTGFSGHALGGFLEFLRIPMLQSFGHFSGGFSDFL